MKGNGRGNGFFVSMVAALAGAFLLGALLPPESAWAQRQPQQQGAKKVYRWVDEEGNVHYSESLPPNWQGESHDELGHDGIVREEDVSHAPPPPVEQKPDAEQDKSALPRDKSGLPRPEPLYSDAEKQQHMDRLLMLRYRSEEELVEAMEVEINQLKYDERLLTATRESLQASLRSNIDTAGHRQRAGIAVDENTFQEIKRLRAQLQENERSLVGLQKREDNIREVFTRDIARWRELSKMYAEGETG